MAMQGPVAGLLWLLWQRARLPFIVGVSAIIGIGSLMLVYFLTDESDIERANTIAVVSAVGVLMMVMGISAVLARGGNVKAGTGFLLRSEFHYPVKTFTLCAVPFLFIVGLVYLGFVISVSLLCEIFGLSYPHPLLHFLVLEYLIIITAVSWATDNAAESGVIWLLLLLCLYMGWLVPDFSFETDTSLFTAGEPSSLILPALIAATSVVLMFRGVQRQRSGEHLLLSAGLATMQFQDWRILHLFRRIKFACPTTSGDAAFRWQQRQFRGAQVAIGMGASIGILVVVFLQLTSVRGFWDGSVDLDEISGIAFIFFWAVTIGILATVFGASYSNGVARFSTFDRTLPLSTAKMTAMRLQTVVICVLLIGLVELLTIALLGSLILEKFSLVRQEFYQQVLAQLDQGLFYLLMRVILSACLLYVLVVLCAVFITWFAIRSRLMTFLFSALVVYWLLVVAGLVAFTEGQEFVTTAQTVGTIHGWIISAGIIAAAIYLLKYLVDARVLNESQAMILVGVGLSLAVLQLVDLQFFAELNSDGSIDANVLSYSAGLLPLTATVVALWTQFRVRHG